MGKNFDFFCIDLKNFDKFKVMKVCLVFLLRDLKNEKIRKVGIVIKIGWMW